MDELLESIDTNLQFLKDRKRAAIAELAKEIDIDNAKNLPWDSGRLRFLEALSKDIEIIEALIAQHKKYRKEYTPKQFVAPVVVEGQ